MNLTNAKIKELSLTANKIRQSIITMLNHAKSGHTAGALGMTDVFTLLYFHILKHDPKHPNWHLRDYVILSNGHICPVLYASMAHSGYFPIEELNTLRKFGSRLQGHPHKEFLPYLETSSGPLGEGLSQAVGMAIADRINNGEDTYRYFYCLMGDGELDEGQIWEAMMLAGKEKLGNLIAFVDRNRIQIDGDTEDVMPLDDLKKKWESFNWHVQEVNGHDFKSLEEAINKAKTVTNMPSVILARTIPSKGVPAWEGDYRWHGMAPNDEQAKMALAELKKEEKLISTWR